MCGIAGVVGSPSPPPGVLDAMGEAMLRRGPDRGATSILPGCALVFRRLAIIDLDPRSDQPMQREHLSLVFNGEIYNYLELRAELVSHGHRFTTTGDAEVLIHAWLEWGEQALDRLNGMFAFAIWDAQAQELTLATDPFGEKPLYWLLDDGRLVFASTISAILAVSEPRAAEQDAVSGFVALGLMPPPDKSFVTGLRRLPGGDLLKWQGGGVQRRRYYSPNPVQPPATPDEQSERLRELLADSVRWRLRSDVPVGSSLSGGIDSSAIVGTLGAVTDRPPQHAFTARFRGYVRDEWIYAASVANAASVAEHHAVEPTADGLLDDLAQLILDHEEPVRTSSVYAQWCVMRAAASQGVVVLLDGQGADELFGGYPGAPGEALLSQGLMHGLRDQRRLEMAVAFAARTAPRRLIHAYRKRASSPYATPATVRASLLTEPAQPPWRFGDDPLRRELSLELTVTSLPELLRYADRNSMAHSREVRLPFLDRRIVDFALGLPTRALYDGHESKHVLREAVKDLVPAAVLERRDKVGYETPEAAWLGSDRARGVFSEILLDGSSETSSWLDRKEVEADVRNGKWRDPGAIWRAVNVEVWLRALSGGLKSPAFRSSCDPQRVRAAR